MTLLAAFPSPSVLLSGLALGVLAVLAGIFAAKRPNPRAEFMRAVRALDKALVASGAFPDSILTPWWTDTLETFFASTATTLVIRAGRQSRKSTVACLVTVAWGLYGGWKVPRGAVAIIPFLSVDKGEAAERIRTIGLMLDALVVPHIRRGDEIELKDRNVIFRVYAASVRTVGMTAIAIVADEVAKWKDVETLQNPAREVFASVKPATVTQIPFGAFVLAFSSPVTEQDFHAELVRAGDTEAQLVFAAATWIANPSVTEETTHALEPDERVWAREFAAEPSAAVSAAFEEDVITASISPGVRKRPRQIVAQHIFTIDPGANRSWSTFNVGHFEFREIGGEVRRVLVQDALVILKPTLFALKKVSFDAIVETIVKLCLEYGIRVVHSDIFNHGPLASVLAEKGLRMADPMGMSINDQARHSRALDDRMGAKAIDLLDVEDQTAQLRGAVRRETQSKWIITTPDKRRMSNDVLATILLANDDVTFGKVPASGGASGIMFSPPTFSFAPGRGLYETSEGYYFRLTPDGREIRAAPPPGSKLAKVEAARRWLAGTFTPEEMATGRTIDDFQEEGARVLHEHQG